MTKQELIDQIVDTEWQFFTAVQSADERPSCQDDYNGFQIMRRSQFDVWDYRTLVLYSNDLAAALREDRNPLTEKYAYMMEYTSPEEYDAIKDRLPVITPEKEYYVRTILSFTLAQTEEFFKMYPGFARHSRPLYKCDDSYAVSIETYTRGELSTYSVETLQSLWRHMQLLSNTEQSYVILIYRRTAEYYGYPNIQEAEAAFQEQ